MSLLLWIFTLFTMSSEWNCGGSYYMLQLVASFPLTTNLIQPSSSHSNLHIHQRPQDQPWLWQWRLHHHQNQDDDITPLIVLQSKLTQKNYVDEDDDEEEEYFYLTRRIAAPTSTNSKTSQDNDNGMDSTNTNTMNDESLRFMMLMMTTTVTTTDTGGSSKSRQDMKLSSKMTDDDNDGSSSTSTTTSSPSSSSLVEDTLQPPSINWKRGSILFDENPITAYNETQIGLHYWTWCTTNLPAVVTGMYPWKKTAIVQQTNEQPWSAIYNMVFVRIPAICILLVVIGNGIVTIASVGGGIIVGGDTQNAVKESITNWNTLSSLSLTSSSVTTPLFIIILLLFVLA